MEMEQRQLKAVGQLKENASVNRELLAFFANTIKQMFPNNPFYPRHDILQDSLIWVSDKPVTGLNVHEILSVYKLCPNARSLLINTGGHGSAEGSDPQQASLGEGRFIVEDFVSAISTSINVAVHIVSPGVPPKYLKSVDVINAWCYSSVDKLKDYYDRKSAFSNLAISIREDTALIHAIKQAAAKKSITFNNVIAFLGITQVGKSSTLNYLSGCMPFIERGYIDEASFENTDPEGVGINRDMSKRIFKYLYEKNLLEQDEEGNYFPNFSIGQKLLDLNNGNQDRQELSLHISNLFLLDMHDVRVQEISSFICQHLNSAIRKKEASDDSLPHIGYVNPIFQYGAGLSTTISAQALDQQWGVTTFDLPGSGDIRGQGTSLVSAYSTFCSLSNTTNIKGAVILLTYAQLSQGATTAKSLIEVLQSASNILGETISSDNICILVTKVPLMKKIRGKEQAKKKDEIQNDIQTKLQQFVDLLAHNKEPNNSYNKIRHIVSDIINKRHFLAVTPLISMNDNYQEKYEESNVNNDNRNDIITLLAGLPLVKVAKGYFSQAYSAKNCAISSLVTELEDELVSLSSLAKREAATLKKKFDEVFRRSQMISLIINGSEGYLQEIAEAISTEREFFESELKKITQGLQCIDIEKITGDPHDKITVNAIKNHAMIEAKKRSSEKMELEDPGTFDQLSKALAEIRRRVSYKEKKARDLHQIIEQTDPDKWHVLASDSRSINSYWKESASLTNITLNVDTSYPSTKGQVTIEQNNANYVVNHTNSNDKKRFTFSIVPRENPGFFTSYIFKGTVYISTKEKEVLNARLANKNRKLDALKISQANSETLVRLLNEEQDVWNQMASVREQYINKLEGLKEQAGLHEDSYNIMSISDIRKVMVSSLLMDAATYLNEIEQILVETRLFLLGHEHRSRFDKICHTVDCLRLLSDTLEIGLALNPEERFGNMNIKNLQGIEHIVNKIVGYTEQLKTIQNRALEQSESIQNMQRRLSALSIDINRYDQAVERAVLEYNDKSQKNRCIIS